MFKGKNNDYVQLEQKALDFSCNRTGCFLTSYGGGMARLMAAGMNDPP